MLLEFSNLYIFWAHKTESVGHEGILLDEVVVLLSITNGLNGLEESVGSQWGLEGKLRVLKVLGG